MGGVSKQYAHSRHPGADSSLLHDFSKDGHVLTIEVTRIARNNAHASRFNRPCSRLLLGDIFLIDDLFCHLVSDSTGLGSKTDPVPLLSLTQMIEDRPRGLPAITCASVANDIHRVRCIRSRLTKTGNPVRPEVNVRVL